MRAERPLLRFAFLLLLCLCPLIAGCPLEVSRACACNDDAEGVILHCFGGDPIDSLLTLLRRNQAQLGLLKQLVVQNSAISNLTAKFFDGLYIRKLALQNCGIQTVDSHAFDGLQNSLQDLNLANNSLAEIPAAALAKMTSLLTLDLSNNSIGDIRAEHQLPSMPKLFEIKLNDNQIGDLHKGFFDNVKNSLQSITLGRNQLKAVPASALRGFRQLMALHLHSNQIEQLDPLSFMNLPMVNLLNLAANRIRNISKQAFINVPSLRYLYLTDNNIEDIAEHQFASFELLEMIDLSNNRLRKLRDGSFAALPQLKQLYLGNNRIDEIEEGAFANSSIAVLILEANQLTEVTDSMFTGLRSLQQVSLKENRIKNIHQNAFYDTPELVMADLSHNEIFDLSPSTFVTQPKILLIDLSYNKIVRIPYGSFGRRVVTVLLQENPLVCTEKVHMLQQGVGMMITNSEDIICGAHRSVDKIAGESPTFSTDDANTTLHSQFQRPIAHEPPVAGGSLGPASGGRGMAGNQMNPSAMPTGSPMASNPMNSNAIPQTLANSNQIPQSQAIPNPMAAASPSANPMAAMMAANFNQDQLWKAFQQAEADQRRFETRGGQVDSLSGTPPLNPAIPPIPGTDSRLSANSEILQRPTASEGLSIKRLSSGAAHSMRPMMPQPTNIIEPTAVEPSSFVQSPEPPTTAAIPSAPPTMEEPRETTVDIGNIPGRIYPMPVPFLHRPQRPNIARPINDISQTLPPNIRIAPPPPSPTSAAGNQLEEPSSPDPTQPRNRPIPTPTRTRPTDSAADNSFLVNEIFAATPSGRVAEPTADVASAPVIRGDRNLGNLLIIICISTVGIVVFALSVGMCIAHRRRGSFLTGSANSSMTARSQPLYATGTNGSIHRHASLAAAQPYIPPNQFNASRMGTLERSRHNSANYAAPAEDVYQWLYQPGPYSAYPNK